jgi:Fe-S-cluster-containing dehydrogenase component/anaerobic selenocysteine-containing dehydrogenase
LSTYPYDELDRLERTPEVLSGGEPFEKPAKIIEKGPYYKWAEELVPELADLQEKTTETPSLSLMPFGRRDFMKYFSMASVASAAACVRRPVEHAIPYVIQPVDMVPGVAQHYATTCQACPASCGVVVKVREGRPVKLEGHKEHPISQGALCGLGQAQLQALYHPERLKAPQVRHGGRLDDMSWDDVYSLLGDRLKNAKKVAILTGSASGHRHEFFREFLGNAGSNPETDLYTFEPNTLFSAIAKAHEGVFGHEALPRIELDEAKIIVGLGADFLEMGTSPVFHGKGFSKSRNFDGKLKGEFIQFEAGLSLTGAKADKRYPIPPGTEWAAAILLLQAIHDHPSSKGSGETRAIVGQFLSNHIGQLEGLAQEVGVSKETYATLAHMLLSTPSIVLAGGAGGFDKQGTLLQTLTIYINLLSGAYEKTVFFDSGWVQAQVRSGDMNRFIADSKGIDLLFVIDSNPVFTLPPSWNLEGVLKSIPTVVSIQAFPCETDQVAEFVLPGHHYLESWGDEEPVAGLWSLRQPVTRATTESRQAEEILLWVSANGTKPMPYKDYYTYLQKKWSNFHGEWGGNYSLENFQHSILKKGFIGKLATRPHSAIRSSPVLGFKFPDIQKGYVLLSPLDHRLYDGRGAHLPVLQEIGDSMTTVTWDSTLAMHPKTMEELGLKSNELVQVKNTTGSFEAAIYPLPGLHPKAFVLKRGNGHGDNRSTVSFQVGTNPLVLCPEEADPYSAEPVTSGQSIEISGFNPKKWHRLAAMQKHADIGNRSDIIKTVTVAELAKKYEETVDLDTVPDLFPALEVADHQWGMSIDLDKCTGCGACMVACATENNVPQVGREQVMMGREMHWIRLDRYFSGSLDEPTVTFQPVMCQHCSHAPCEAVCPVFATTHDPEGLNAMTYNRCVGTRYCANGCPYKVRRFNWWTHKWNEIGQRLQDRNPRALNPDVTVRTRGVMEKCSFCVGRLRDAKHEAKKEGHLVTDGSVQTACQQTCPSDAIHFGNRNDKESQISKKRKDPRAYLLLGGDPKHGHYGLKTMPSVSYLAKIVHTKAENAHHP